MNRAIGNFKDPHLCGVGGKPGVYKETEPSIYLSKAYALLPGCHDYQPKSKEINGQPVIFSSSVFLPKEEKKYVAESKGLYKIFQ